MDHKKLADELGKLKEAVARFRGGCGESILSYLREDTQSPEDGLKKELLLELMDHIYGIQHLVEYMGKEVVRHGVLRRGAHGEILFDGEELRVMQEIEVLVTHAERGCETWTRSYVGGSGSHRFLVGVDRSLEIDGMRARMRA